MDYFVYKRKYKKEEWQPCSYDHSSPNVNILLYWCLNCEERIWGAWEYPHINMLKHDAQSYTYENVGYCFTLGFEEMLRKSETKVLPIDHPIYRRIEAYGKEAKNFLELDKCPICGAKLTKSDLTYLGHHYIGRYWSVKEAYDFDEDGMIKFDKNGNAIRLNHFRTISSALSYYRKDLPAASKEKGDSKHKQFLSQCSQSSAIASGQMKKCVLENTDQLMHFLKHLITMEKNIYSVSERLKELYRCEYEYEVCATESTYDLLAEKKKIVADTYEAWTTKQAENPEKGVHVPKYAGTYPSKPVEPKAPNAPTQKKPGLFNKKRVLAEHAALMEQYKKEYAQYEEKLNIYNGELAIYNQKIAQIQEELDKKQAEVVEQAKLAHSKECEELRNKYLAAQQEYDQINGSFDSISTPQIVALKCLQEEITQAEELLLNLHQGKRKVFDTGVIFEKYNDFVAIASFYEYLSSGRCTTLEGPHGAYNLYESEIRMNAIVSQLADVIKSLKQIQKNQFVIYTAINEATNELAALNKATQKMNVTLNAMHGELATISRNTEVTAFYAKKNAELMDTLCFLTALN